MRVTGRPLPRLLAGMLGMITALPLFAAGEAGTVAIQLPEEPVRFMPGPGQEVAERNCVKCHSADYIYMQPPLTAEQWHATVMKMKKSYGAPVEEGDVDSLVTYLMTQNGKRQ